MDKQSVDNYPREKVNQFWQGCFTRLVILASISLILYIGYCSGLWGRNSLLVQYLFQCKCPSFSEEWRYSDQIDVLVSACNNGGIRLSPSGRWLLVYDRKVKTSPNYLLNINTGNEILVDLPEGSAYFLNDDLLYIFIWYGGNHEGGYYIYDRLADSLYPIPNFIELQPKAYTYGKVNQNMLFTTLLSVKEVFIIDQAFPPVIALSSDFRTHPEHSFVFDYSALPDHKSDLMEQFLEQNNITYHHATANYPHELVSPNGKLIARNDGIYLVETNQLIVKAPPLSVRGWTNDGHGVIYLSTPRCLLPLFLPGIDDVGCAVRVHQPVLLLKVPEEYLSSEKTP